MEKRVDGKVSSNADFSHGLASSMGENITSIQNPKDTEISTVSSERIYSAEQTSMRSDFSAEDGQSANGKRKGLDSFVAGHNKMLKTESSSSKESGEVVQLSSVDSTDPIPCQSSKEIVFEKKSLLTLSDELNDQETSIVTKLDSTSLESSRHCNFDLNEGMEIKGAISVVAKVGVPMGLPKKPLQFGGELGWRRAGSASAFRPTAFKFPKIDKGSCSIRGIDLNVAATMDSELPSDESPTDYDTSKPPGRFILDLNSCSESDENRHQPDGSSFDLNGNADNTRNNNSHHIENQHFLTRSVAADSYTRTISGLNNAGQYFVDMRRPPSYWVNLSSMRGVEVVQPQPFFVPTTPTAEQVQMVLPSGFYIGKINNSPPAFYPYSVPLHLNSHHGTAPVSQIPGSVLAAYPGPVHFLENHQGANPHANMRPNFFPNGCIPLMENGRGVVNPEVLIPVRNLLFETKEKAVEQAPLPASQINYRQMASWN